MKPFKFFEEVKAEMAKVTWSSREELVYSTVVVLTVMAFLSIFVGVVDLIFSQTLKLILG